MILAGSIRFHAVFIFFQLFLQPSFLRCFIIISDLPIFPDLTSLALLFKKQLKTEAFFIFRFFCRFFLLQLQYFFFFKKLILQFCLRQNLFRLLSTKTLRLSERVEVLSREGEWTKVRGKTTAGTTLTGYCYTEYLLFD